MNKKILMILLIVLGALALAYVFISTGVIKLETVGADQETPTTIISVEDLEDGCYYVWHNEKTTDITEDLKGTVDKDVFKICPGGEVNWEKNSFVNHTVWFTSANDKEIPTLYPGDQLLYISSTYVPYEGISWERFADYGYTIGVANLEGDKSGHYRITNAGDKNGYAGYVYPGSDATVLETFSEVSNVFIDKIGSVKIRDDFVSDGGTVSGLEKNKKYVCEWYTGTYYQDFEMTANIHAFCSMETFTTYDYDFLHSNCIAISIPSWLKTGYYYLDGIGFFRYLSDSDAKQYNGEAYDANIDWNDPIIIYDENGFVKYNPTAEDDLGTGTASESTDSETNSGVKADTTQAVQEEEQVQNENESADGGAEEYEDIYNEIIIP